MNTKSSSTLCNLFLVLLWMITECNAQCSSDTPITVSGKATCYGLDLAHTKITLNHVIGFVTNEIGVSHTDAEGRFNISGQALDATPFSGPDQIQGSMILFFQFEYRRPGETSKIFASGEWFPLEISGFQGQKNVGTLAIDNASCQRYIYFHEVLQDFKRRTGRDFERHFFIYPNEIITAPRPFVTWDHVRIPRGFYLTYDVVIHEFGHIIRNIYDGGPDHFHHDLAQYGGFESHTCSTKTSFEFAFNEGVASYWARECMNSNPNGPMNIEGNVAAALRQLQETCSTTDNGMLEVLRKNPWVLHTYRQFENAHKRLYGCPS
ncbi:hypothetical protein BWQ96_00310 [Gracilariopsis chorda]|uniref:Uncharacterized protein n=1 Tax=Gracilariopsis chorda TaxID=448386 RepID=A0A2V3JDY7_9FLOR|nr:hypothetical protein BWQ96_00310 [Gracilariopsis chorda]|eukprot:PXF50150.1 hypothetical protein BWQ96_00310 [Gracilariopsis chorda]